MKYWPSGSGEAFLNVVNVMLLSLFMKHYSLNEIKLITAKIVHLVWRATHLKWENQHFWLFQLCSNFTCVWFDNSSSIRVALWIGVGVCWGWGRGGGSREVGGGGPRGTRFAHTRGGGTSFQRSPSLLIEDQQIVNAALHSMYSTVNTKPVSDCTI